MCNQEMAPLAYTKCIVISRPWSRFVISECLQCSPGFQHVNSLHLFCVKLCLLGRVDNR